MTTHLIIKIAISFFVLLAIVDVLIVFSSFSLHEDLDAWEEQEEQRLSGKDTKEHASTQSKELHHFEPWRYGGKVK